jgi:predicted nucleic acid-binding protein
VSLVVDTNVVIDLLRGREEATRLLEASWEPLMVSAVTVHEIYMGMRPDEEEMTETMLSSFMMLSFGAEEARLTSAWWRTYRARGITLDFRDLAIAAAAVTRNLTLATANVKDFPMPELRVEEWPPPA